MTGVSSLGGVDLSGVRPVASVTEDAEVVARVAWSALAEPGDSGAGALVGALGAARALELVYAEASGRGGAVVRACLGAVAPDELLGLQATVDAGLRRWGPRLDRTDVARAVERAETVGATLLVPGDPDWPERTADLGDHAPLVLWCRGRAAPVFERPTLAVVGARANTLAGAEAAAEITSSAADDGCAVVSGGAYGIDAVAHRVAIAAGAPTVAVLAGGIDQLYPVGHVELLRNVSRQGMLLAESPPGTRPTRWRFLARNRMIAAMGDAVVVVEAAARSGALNTANHAAQLGRPVFAVPGAFSSPASVGCHRLVADRRAELAVEPSDPARAALGFHAGTDSQGPVPLRSSVEDPDVVRVLDALGRRPIGDLEAARRSGLSVAAAADALALAELQGLVRRQRDGWTVA